METFVMDPYDVLGLSMDATISEIRLVYRKRVLKCHPDKIQGDEYQRDAAQREFQQVQQAYEILSDDRRRAFYDVLAMLRETKRARESRLSKDQTGLDGLLDKALQCKEKISTSSKYDGFVMPTKSNSTDEKKKTDTPAGSNRAANELLESARVYLAERHKQRDRERRSRLRDYAPSQPTEYVRRRGGPYSVYDDDDADRKLLQPSKEASSIIPLGVELSFVTKSHSTGFVRRQNDGVQENTYSRHAQNAIHTRGIDDRRRHSPSPSRHSYYDESKSNALKGGTDHHRHMRRTVTLPIRLGSSCVTAIPDTGADENAISVSLLQKLKLEFEENTDSLAAFQLANGSFIRSIGTVRTEYSFEKSQAKSFIELHVFAKLAVPLIIGKAFLQATETLTKYASRLTICAETFALAPPRILHMNRPTQRLRCYLGVHLVDAHADTGAEMNLSSPEFAARRGFQIEEPDPSHREVVLADGSRAPISGQFRAKFDAYHPPEREDRQFGAHEKYFYILNGLTSDILLSNELLFEISAFETQNQSFINSDPFCLYSGLNLVTWLSRRQMRLLNPNSRSSTSTDMQAGIMVSERTVNALEAEFQQKLDEDDAFEQFRRHTADKQMLTLTAAERNIKTMEETQRRQDYEASRAKKVQDHRDAKAQIVQRRVT